MPFTTLQKVILGGAAIGTYVLVKRKKKFETKTMVFNGRNILIHVPNTFASTRVLLYFHGNGATLAGVSELIPVFDSAKRPPIVIAPQLASNGGPGDLADAGAIAFLLQAVAESLPSGTLNPRGAQVDALSHSGGYLAASAALSLGGITVSNVGLLDSLYGHMDVFKEFALSPQAKHFVNVYGGSTAGQSIALAKKLSEEAPDQTYFSDAGSSGNADDAVLAEALRYPIATIRTTVAHGLVPRQYIKTLLSAFA